MTKELRKKFILINMALVGTVLLIVFAVLCFQNYQRLEQDSMRVMERYFNDNGARPVPELEFDKKREWRNFPLMLSFCAVVDSNGELVSYQSDNLTVSEATVSQAVKAALDKMESSGKNSGTLSGLDLRYLARGQQGQMWIAFVDRTQEYASMRSFLTSALQLGAAGLIALFLISFFLSAWVVRPVEHSWAQQRQFVADASHELKTPLTVILTNTELLQSPDYDEAQKQQFTDGIRTMAQQMRALVERLLELARAENARPQAAFAPVCLSEVAETSALLFEAALYERGLTLETQVEPELTVSGDERQLGQLVEILLDNARKYASGGTVRLQLQRSGRHSCHLSLENEGPALSPQQLQEIFKRFTRADPARTRSGSFGLGLAIAQAIIQAHHGKIWAESRDGRNTFHVELPLRTGREKHQETSKKGI